MRRTFVAFALTSSLLTSTAAQPDLFAPLWRFLSSFLTPTTTQSGAGWDPDGLPHSPAPPVHPKAGAEWDPDGLVQPHAGAEWDPSGKPNAGAEWDPNG